MFRVVSLAVAILIAVPAVSVAQAPQAPPPLPNIFEGTPREQAACRGDSVKFCKNLIPDNFKVLACLKDNRAKLHVACRQVLESHGQ